MENKENKVEVHSKSKQEDMKLIKDALAGKQTAYARLMNKYYQLVYNLIYRMIPRKEDAEYIEDLTQEAFIKAFASLANFDSQFAFSTWLFKIATNNAIDYLRKKKLNTFSIDKELESEESEYKFEIPDEENKPDKRMMDSQMKLVLDEAIEKLPEKFRKVIIMRHKQEKEYEEIAKELDLPLGTVKAHIFRGRELLNKYLKDKISQY